MLAWMRTREHSGEHGFKPTSRHLKLQWRCSSVQRHRSLPIGRFFVGIPTKVTGQLWSVDLMLNPPNPHIARAPRSGSLVPDRILIPGHRDKAASNQLWPKIYLSSAHISIYSAKRQASTITHGLQQGSDKMLSIKELCCWHQPC